MKGVNVEGRVGCGGGGFGEGRVEVRRQDAVEWGLEMEG